MVCRKIGGLAGSQLPTPYALLSCSLGRWSCLFFFLLCGAFSPAAGAEAAGAGAAAGAADAAGAEACANAPALKSAATRVAKSLFIVLSL